MTAVAQDTYLAELIAEAQDYLDWLEDLHAGLQDGTYNWRDWDPELTVIDRQEAAVDDCWTAICGARADLAALQGQR